MMSELQEVKDEIAQVSTRLENVEGHFDNFNTTLTNHMTDYNRKLKDLYRNFKWGFWVLFTLTTVAFSGLITISIMLLQRYLVGG